MKTSRMILVLMMMAAVSGMAYAQSTPISITGTGPDSLGNLASTILSSGFTLYNQPGGTGGYSNNSFPDGPDSYYLALSGGGTLPVYFYPSTVMTNVQWTLNYEATGNAKHTILFGWVSDFVYGPTTTAKLHCTPTVYNDTLGNTDTYDPGAYQGFPGEGNARLSTWVYDLSWTGTSGTLTPDVPEPATCGLLALGFGMLLRRRR